MCGVEAETKSVVSLENVPAAELPALHPSFRFLDVNGFAVAAPDRSCPYDRSQTRSDLHQFFYVAVNDIQPAIRRCGMNESVFTRVVASDYSEELASLGLFRRCW